MTAIDAICAPRKLKPITRERIERAQLALAGIISRRDNETARRLKPLWDRFEAELASFDEVESLRAKAERLLASRT
ncbi:hypothetical protein [Tardiphaga sp. P9-11]|uniref:hypothetical protein n=1 Tax=Tardiphaga sp. P9-11 TaxID=2024614 RepID=UPI0011F2BD44|nr:hypothetical protein [Tardiphaga sp. P9-11]